MANLHPWDREGNTIDFVQHIRASPERVWDAITTTDGLQRWLRVTSTEIPSVPGASFHLTWEARGCVSRCVTRRQVGFVKTFVPPRLLALEWTLPQSGVTTFLSLQIQTSFALFGESRVGECDIWLIHSSFPTHGLGLFEFDGHFRHWRQDIGDLAAWLEARPGKPTPYARAGLQFVGGAPGIGLLVSDVVSGSPAHKAGIKSGDIIRAVDDRVLHSLDDFHDWIDERRPGESGEFALTDRVVNVTVESAEQARDRLLIRSGERWSPVR